MIPVGVALLVLLGGLTWLNRRVHGPQGGRRGGRAIRLTGQHTLHVVQLEGKRFVVGTGPSGPPALVLEMPHAATEGEAEPVPRTPLARPPVGREPESSGWIWPWHWRQRSDEASASGT